MTLKVDGPDVGDRIGHLKARTSTKQSVSLSEVPGEILVVDIFRGHW